MWYSSMGLLALAIQTIINFYTIKNKGDPSPAYRTYKFFLFGVSAYYVTDALWGILYEIRPVVFVYIDTVVYFAAMALSVFLWTRYVIAFLEENEIFSKILSYAGAVFLTFAAVAIVVNFFYPVLFSFDENGTYTAHTFRYVTLFIQLLLFLSTAVYTFLSAARSKDNAFSRRCTVGSFGLAMTALIVLQVLYPLVPFYSVGCLIGTCLIHTFVIGAEKDEHRKELEELVCREKEQKKELGSALHLAYFDSLTGVKNKHAYVEEETRIDRLISENKLGKFGIVVFDLNGLKTVNDTDGHEAGDEYLKEASDLINRFFTNCPVYRIGGDEFAAFLTGDNYDNRKKMLDAFERQIEKNLFDGSVVIASGLDEFTDGKDNCFRQMFERADKNMYERKAALKNLSSLGQI